MQNNLKNKKIAVLMGGNSGEREISLLSGNGVLTALKNQGFNAEKFDPAEQNLNQLKNFDIAFIALHGRHGEDGCIQGTLELLGIPYTGPNVMTSAIGMDKYRTKLIWKAAGLATPDSLTFGKNDTFDEQTYQQIIDKLSLPVFVKPATEGSSIGINKANNLEQLKIAIEIAFQHDDLIIVEQAILGGGEFSIGILGDLALPIIKIVPKNDFYDYDAKYNRDDTEYLCPAPDFSPEQVAKISAEAVQAFKALGGTGWGRIDFLCDNNKKHYFLEINTSPGMTSHSLVPMEAGKIGISYEELVIKILELAEQNKK